MRCFRRIRIHLLACALTVGAVNTASAVDRDSDLDGLKDSEEGQYGTCIGMDDTDYDGLLDGWEVNGLGTGANRLDLKALGADPLRKDLFVEMDYMVPPDGAYELKPSAAVMDRLINIFANAEVENEGCTDKEIPKGIALHLDLDDAIPHDPSLDPYIAEFAKLRDKHFTPARKRVYRYMVWADRSPRLLGVALGIPHSDFIVTLGSRSGGTDNEKVGTFLHELGHTLNLRHGGCTHFNYKPNHLSAMNYAYLTGWPGEPAREIDLQRTSTHLLNEAALDESKGVRSDVALVGRKIAICQVCNQFMRRFNSLMIEQDGWIDWNGNGVKDLTPVSRDLDSDGKTETEFCGWANEWEMLVFRGGLVGYSGTLAGDAPEEVWKGQTRPLPFEEISPAEYSQQQFVEE